MKIVVFFLSLLLSLDSVFAQAVLKDEGVISNQYIVYFNAVPNVAARIKTDNSNEFNRLKQTQKFNINQLNVAMSETDLIIKASLWLNQSVAITLSSHFLEQLKALPFVANAKQDRRYKLEPLSTTTLVPSGEVVQSNLFDVGIESVWSAGFKGQGVVVAVLDSGVDINHATLKSSWRGGTNSWFDPIDGSTEPSDFSGHGTAVTSIILGNNDNKDNAYIGVAPQAQWIAAKIFSSTSSGSTDNTSISNIQQALQWVLDPDGDSSTPDYPDIVQNSWGIAATEGSCSNTDFNLFLSAIDALGIDLVFAVGNSGSTASSRLAPSYHKNVISVGALEAGVSSVETILPSSSRGPNLCENTATPSLMAPGSVIRAAEKSLGSVSATRNLSSKTGTSFSSPHVSGVLALLRSQFSASSDYLQFRNALFDSAKDLGVSGVDNDFGHGLVKADGAVTKLLDAVADTTDNDVIFSSAKYVFAENGTTADVDIIRTGDLSTGFITTIISDSGSATSGSDFTPLSTVVEFLVGESIKTVSVNILNDSVAENEESFNLIISTNSLKKKIFIEDDDGDLEEEEEIGGFGVEPLIILFMLWFIRSVKFRTVK